MQTQKNVGVHGIGVYLPEQVRRNEDYPADLVARWREKAARRYERLIEFGKNPLAEGARRALDAIAALGTDPFQGARERRVMPDGMKATDMQTAAAREAIARAAIDPQEIGMVVSFTMNPDFIGVPDACVVHANLGLPERCRSFNVDAVCNSLMVQMSAAEQAIAAGKIKYALLTQCSALNRMPMSGENYDSWFGDAATAMVLGPVSEGRGILGESHRTDGKLSHALVFGVPGKRWCDMGEVILYVEDHAANFDMVTNIVERARQAVDEALGEAGLRRDEVSFYACHQAFQWLREVTQDYIGLSNARSVDTFEWAASVSAANLPLVLATGEREGLLRDGDAVALFQGGTGMTWSSMILRWGR